MLIIPAIDLRNGKCVRLIQGDPERETIYSEDPVSVAKEFESSGAKLIHVVDLDGAFAGHPVNQDTVIEISKSISIPIEIGGGIRTLESAEEYISAGINRIILGTAVIADSYKNFVKNFRDYIIISIDAKDSMIATHGWKKKSDMPAIDFIKELINFGIYEIVYTDISTDGMLTGPNVGSVEKILSSVVSGIQLIASGGIGSIDDIKSLKKFSNSGLKGCIIGKAIYDGRLDIHDALKLVE